MVRGRWFKELVRYGVACAVASAGVLLFAVTPAPAEEKKIDPPGKCGWKTYNELSELKKAACNLVRACDAGDSCQDIEDKKKGFQLCIDARTLLSTTCFGGADAGHTEAVRQLTNGITNCNEVHKKKVASGECRLATCPAK